jgi:uncharacterized protein YndB with AHSA1/START domain
MTATPTGRLGRQDGRDAVVFERTFTAPITDVWAAITESDRLERWFGTWTGDPASGSVLVRMNAEGEEAPVSTFTIDRCEPPRLLGVSAVDESGTWVLVAELTAAGGVTTLRFSQVIADPAMIENTGPGWDYYLDRLVAAETGGDPGALDFDRDYYPAQRDHYVSIQKALAGA